MQRTEVAELFGPILQKNAQRRRTTDYAAVLLLIVVAIWWGHSAWLTSQVPKIESLTLVPGSIAVLGPADRVAAGGNLVFCPGDTMTVRYRLIVDGSGVIYADDAAHYADRTVKFSTLWRDIVTKGERSYENEWLIPARPDMAIDGERTWRAGEYTRTISVAASNIYISRYVTPAELQVRFRIAEDCP